MGITTIASVPFIIEVNAHLHQQRSCNITIKTSIQVDSMEYLELGIKSQPNEQKQGSTSDHINITISLDNGLATH